MTHSHRTLSLLFVLAFAAPLESQSRYTQPPAPIAQILDAPQTPAVSISPDRKWLLLLERSALPTIAEISAPELKLAGIRINPRTNGPSREISTFKGLRLRSLQGAAERTIAVPAGARIGAVRWAPDASSIAFVVTRTQGVELWVADAATGKARALTRSVLNAVGGAPCAWMSSSKALLCRTVVAGRGPAPMAPQVPAGPIIQESEGRTAPNRTYDGLLQTPHDEALFDYYFTSQLAVISLAGPSHMLGKPGLYDAFDPSPNGRYVQVSAMHRPWSYLVPMSRFPRRYEIWDMTGKVVRQIADRPLQEEIAINFDAVEKGPRDFGWRADAPATAIWAEALDDGDPSRVAESRDRVVVLAAPFTGEPQTLVNLAFRASGVSWARGNVAIVEESWNKTRRIRTWIIDPSRLGSAPRLFSERSSEDRYADPGRRLTTSGPLGTPMLLLSPDSSAVFASGAGSSSAGDRPFLDRINLTTGESQRLWRSEAPHYEEVVEVLDNQGKRLVTRRESVSEVPNYYIRDLASGTVSQLTAFKDPAPQFAGVTSQLLTYKRADGVQLSARLYLPAGYDRSAGPLPFVLWAYPREFKTAAAASQVIGSPYRFVRPSGASHLFLLTQGYGVLDGPTMPIIGEGDRDPNDSYIVQLVSSARAAVDKVVEMGVADRNRIAVGGHSYGAFMTANLLAHTNIFRAGIARSGAYNRMLTPFGFQAEERPYWKARDIYTAMSPFSFADSIKTPLLLIHGMADDNSGTFPVQTERFYSALKGNGATVRYVQLPAEAHGYRARESVGHTLWEMVTWLDKYLARNEAVKRIE
ncbi:MAG TPA: prolyl oligopeptidase family serine peptidase [Gemmatimonadaceae bacterium]|nr:prolyl oligopeptidase family serine peptidase [Gemmatimonadaceae bacterium]